MALLSFHHFLGGFLAVRAGLFPLTRAHPAPVLFAVRKAASKKYSQVHLQAKVSQLIVSPFQHPDIEKLLPNALVYLAKPSSLELDLETGCLYIVPQLQEDLACLGPRCSMKASGLE